MMRRLSLWNMDIVIAGGPLLVAITDQPDGETESQYSQSRIGAWLV